MMKKQLYLETIKILRHIINHFVYNAHLISLGAVGIAATFLLLINESILIFPLLIIYLLTLISLLHDRLKEREVDYLTNPERTKKLEKYFKNANIIIFASFCLIFAILFLNKREDSLIFIIFLFLLIFLYTKFFKKLTRKIIGFKNIYFSLIVAFLLIFISLYYFYNFLNFTFLIIFLFVFLRMYVNTVFLDIKDIESDKKHNLKTFPIVFGPQKTIFFLKIITLISGLLIIFGVVLKIIPIHSLMLLFVVPYAFYYFEKSKKKENFYLVNYVLADAEFILWPISIIIGKIIL